MILDELDSSAPAFAIRICRVAGRFLVFDPESVAALRRKHSMNGMLFGTTPQQPSQNIFLGLPLELRPEEADTLARQNAAYIVDDTAAHWNALDLLSGDCNAKRVYIESIRQQKQAARQAYSQTNAKNADKVAIRTGQSKVPISTQLHPSDTKSEASAHPGPHLTDYQSVVSSLTPTSSDNVFLQIAGPRLCDIKTMDGSLCSFLQRRGYYMTPGLRFGAQYSVYPGDPLRFHAHFMANEYDWKTGIPILDIVGGGRLATAVKKSFLFGSQVLLSEEEPLRTFSIEWAAI